MKLVGQSAVIDESEGGLGSLGTGTELQLATNDIFYFAFDLCKAAVLQLSDTSTGVICAGKVEFAIR